MIPFIEIFVLLTMTFCHIVDDFYLQPGILSSMKQKSWWEKNAPDKMYKHDYLMALFIHSFSWAFMINLPIYIYTLVYGGKWSLGVLLINMVIHFIVDHMKANLKMINLVTDQCIHLFQISITWLIWGIDIAINSLNI